MDYRGSLLVGGDVNGHTAVPPRPFANCDQWPAQLPVLVQVAVRSKTLLSFAGGPTPILQACLVPVRM